MKYKINPNILINVLIVHTELGANYPKKILLSNKVGGER